MVRVSGHPLIQHKLAKLRSVETSHAEFRALVRDISVCLAYEATEHLPLTPVEVATPVAMAPGFRLMHRVGLVPILRAGLGMVDGVWQVLPEAEVWHIGLYRDEATLQPIEYYNKLPSRPTVDEVLVLDPMLATGGSAAATIDIVKRWGVAAIRFIGLIGAPEGVAYLQDRHPDVAIHLAAIDDNLNHVGYIVPGLGDAGDRQFGTSHD